MAINIHIPSISINYYHTIIYPCSIWIGMTGGPIPQGSGWPSALSLFQELPKRSLRADLVTARRKGPKRSDSTGGWLMMSYTTPENWESHEAFSFNIDIFGWVFMQSSLEITEKENACALLQKSETQTTLG